MNSCRTVKLNRSPVIILTVVFILSFCSPVPAQLDQSDESIEESIFQSSQNLHQWGSISSFHGLPSEKVNAIAQTPDGFVWFGTDNGIAKFDGRRVQTNVAAGLSSLKIFHLALGSDGTLWIATEKGAFYFRDNVFRAIEESREYAINSIHVGEGEVFLANEGGTVFRAEKKSNTSYDTEIVFEESVPIKSIVKSGSEVLIGTFNAGLQKIVPGGKQAIITKPRPFFINVLSNDPSGKMWVGARSSRGNSGLFLVDELPALKIVGQNLGTVNSIGFDAASGVWIGTEDRGAYLFEGKEFRKRFTFENTSGGLRSNKVLAAFVDREGVVWFGTDKGVSRYDARSPRNERISDNIQSNFVRTLFRTKKGVQYAGTNRGLFYFDDASKVWRAVNGFEQATVYALSESSGGNLLIGAQDGLFSLPDPPGPANSRNELSSETVRAIADFDGQTHFAEFQLGLKSIDGEDEKLIFESDIISLHNEDDKRLWIGTINKGVFVYDGNDTIQKPELDALKETVIRSIAGNEQDGLWFGTEKGLFNLRDDKLELVLPGVEVRGVVAQPEENAEPRIWCATASGLVSLMLDENFGWISSQLDVEQGLTSENLFAILVEESGLLVLGTNRGIARYQPGGTSPLLTPNRIVSQRIHSSSELLSGIDLDYPQNSLSIDVTAISSRTFSEQFQYSFLLFDSTGKIIDKKFGKDSQFLMENLPPDDYRAEIRAYDANLNESPSLKFALTIESAPFPLIATVLGVLLAIALAALIWAILSQRKIFRTSKQLVLANKELNTARLDLANEAERERRRISRDLHDQTLADLRHLQLMADEMDSEKAPEFRGEIENVSEEIRRICEDLSPSVLENIGFPAALEWALKMAVEQVSHEHQIKHDFSCDSDLEEKIALNSAEQIQIYRIVQEVLSNIVRHANASFIRMSATNDEGGFLLRIEDDGDVFYPDEADKGRGLANIRARAKLIKSDVDWSASGEKGMVFTIKK